MLIYTPLHTNTHKGRLGSTGTTEATNINTCPLLDSCGGRHSSRWWCWGLVSHTTWLELHFHLPSLHVIQDPPHRYKAPRVLTWISWHQGNLSCSALLLYPIPGTSKPDENCLYITKIPSDLCFVEAVSQVNCLKVPLMIVWCYGSPVASNVSVLHVMSCTCLLP